MSSKQIFEVILEQDEGSEATGIYIPFDVEKVFGAKRVPVAATINGAEFRSTIMRMRGKFMMAVPKLLREAANAKAGDVIKVELERDEKPRNVEIPADLQKAFDESPQAVKVWEKMSFTHRKEYARAIEDAKKEETRIRRIEKTIEQLLAKG